MLFNSFDFIVFFPIVTVLYYLFQYKYRKYLLLFASYFFYFYWEPSVVLLLFTSTVVDYFCAIKIHEVKKLKSRKLFLWLSITINLGLLFFFKYFGFFTETTLHLLQFFGIEHGQQINSQSYNIQKILLPVGISFYTFQTMSYSIDVYRKDIKPERNFIIYALYVSFFPQLVAGPIERANRLIPQFYKKININLLEIKKGVVLMAWGFFLKLVVADRLGIYSDIVFNNPNNYSGMPLIFGAIFFSFQLYYDFSAYTAIAIGASKILGFNLMHNFNRPGFSKTIQEFWDRWHISFISWIKEYLFIPLAKRKMNRILVVFIVFFIVGLWHGANWTFIVWGLLNGLLFIFERSTHKFRLRMIRKIPFSIPRQVYRLSWSLLILALLILTSIFFRAPSFEIALSYYKNLTNIEGLRINILPYSLELYITLGLLIFVQTIHYFKGNNKIYELVTERPQYIRWLIYISFIIVIVFLSVNRQNNFIYFQF